MHPLLLSLLVLMAPPGGQPQSRLTLEFAGNRQLYAAADTLRLDAPARVLWASGDAEMRFAETRVRADRVRVDLSDRTSPRIVADGRIELTDSRGLISCEHLEADLGTEQGLMVGVAMQTPLPGRVQLSDLLRPGEAASQLRLTADSLTRRGRRVQLRHVMLWIPGAEPPEVRLKARRADFDLPKPGTPGLLSGGAAMRGPPLDGIGLIGTRFQLYGRTVMALPELRVGEGGLMLPMIGSNDTYGVFVEQEVSARLGDRLRLEALPRLGTRRAFSGQLGLRWKYAPVSVALLTDFRSRQQPLGAPRATEVTRFPDLEIRVARNTPVPVVGGAVRGAFAVGRVREYGGPSLWRASLASTYARSLHAGRTSTLAMTLHGYGAHYGTGNGAGWLQTGFRGEKRFGDSFYASLGLSASQRWGETPFRYDRAELPWALDHTARWRFAAHWVASEELYLDLRTGSVARSTIGLSFRDRLLEYGLSFRTYPDFAVSYNARVLGF